MGSYKWDFAWDNVHTHLAGRTKPDVSKYPHEPSSIKTNVHAETNMRVSGLGLRPKKTNIRQNQQAKQYGHRYSHVQHFESTTHLRKGTKVPMKKNNDSTGHARSHSSATKPQTQLGHSQNYGLLLVIEYITAPDI